MNVIQTHGRTLIPSQITHAIVAKDQLRVFPVEYHEVVLGGEDAQKMLVALKAAGFVGEETLINPRRVSVIEDNGGLVRVYLEGADKILYQPASIKELLFPAPESQEPEAKAIAEKPTAKTHRKKVEPRLSETQDESQGPAGRGSE